jgi:hypothetical protein
MERQRGRLCLYVFAGILAVLSAVAVIPIKSVK